MILKNMNSKEKLGQMSSILEDGVNSYIERNRSNLRRRLNTENDKENNASLEEVTNCRD